MPASPSSLWQRGQSWRSSSLPIRHGSRSAGPAHVSGLVWSDPGQYVSTLKSYVIPKPASPLGWLFGFNGLVIDGQYLGFGLVLVLFGGLVAWRRDLRLWFFAIVGLAFLLLSLGAANPLFGFLPVLENILPNRFDQIVYLSVAIMLGIVVDHSYASVTRWYKAARSGDVHPEAPAVEGQARRINPGTTDRAHKPWVGWAGRTRRPDGRGDRPRSHRGLPLSERPHPRSVVIPHPFVVSDCRSASGTEAGALGPAGQSQRGELLDLAGRRWHALCHGRRSRIEWHGRQ